MINLLNQKEELFLYKGLPVSRALWEYLSLRMGASSWTSPITESVALSVAFNAPTFFIYESSRLRLYHNGILTIEYY